MTEHHSMQRFQSSVGEIAFATAGEGPDVVLVHGTPTSSLVWSAVIDRLKDRWRLHYLDLPGFGASEKFEGQEVRLRAFARALREWIEHLGLKCPHLVGHDFGAATVLGAHAIEGLPVASIAVADGVVLNPWGTPFSLQVHRHEPVFAALPGYVHRAMLRAHLATGVARPLAPETESALIEPWSSESGQAAYFRQIAQFDHQYTEWLEKVYPNIEVPVFVLWGEEDRWVDIEAGHRLCGLIPGARLEILPDAGHFSMLDTPGLFARLLHGWLASVT